MELAWSIAVRCVVEVLEFAVLLDIGIFRCAQTQILSCKIIDPIPFDLCQNS